MRGQWRDILYVWSQIWDTCRYLCPSGLTTSVSNAIFSQITMCIHRMQLVLGAPASFSDTLRFAVCAVVSRVPTTPSFTMPPPSLPSFSAPVFKLCSSSVSGRCAKVQTSASCLFSSARCIFSLVRHISVLLALPIGHCFLRSFHQHQYPCGFPNSPPSTSTSTYIVFRLVSQHYFF